jgi:hypothetical protein
MPPDKRAVLITPKFRVAFPQIAERNVLAPGQKGGYSCVALFSPSEFNDRDTQKWAVLIDACNRASVETFRRPMKDLNRSIYKTPFHRGEEQQQYGGFGPGMIFFTMSAYTRTTGDRGI